MADVVKILENDIVILLWEGVLRSTQLHARDGCSKEKKHCCTHGYLDGCDEFWNLHRGWYLFFDISQVYSSGRLNYLMTRRSRNMTTLCHPQCFQHTSLFLALAAHVVLAQPHLSLERSTLDLGTIYQGEVKTISLLIRNTGNSALTIRDVSSSCNCTIAKIQKREIPPTDVTNLEVSFNSAGSQGSLKKQVFLQTNDPASPSALIVLKIMVMTELQPVDQQYNLWLGNVVVGRTERRRISYQNVSRHPLGILGGASGAPEVIVSAGPETLQPDQIGYAEIAVTPVHDGYTQTEFRIKLSSVKQQFMILKLTYIGVKGL